MRDSFVTWTIARPRSDEDTAEARRLAHLSAIRGARADARNADSLGILARITRFVRREQTPVCDADCSAAA